MGFDVSLICHGLCLCLGLGLGLGLELCGLVNITALDTPKMRRGHLMAKGKGREKGAGNKKKEIKENAKRSTSPKRRYFWKQGDYAAMSQYLNDHDWSHMISVCLTPDDLWSAFSDVVHKAIETVSYTHLTLPTILRV